LQFADFQVVMCWECFRIISSIRCSNLATANYGNNYIFIYCMLNLLTCIKYTQPVC